MHQLDEQVLPTMSFASILEHLENQIASKHVIVDLGQISTTVLDIFSAHEYLYYNFSLRRQIVEEIDNSGLGSPKMHLDLQPSPDQLKRFKKVAQGTPIDVVLTWDLFNYLSRRSIVNLMALLSPFCQKGALLHALSWTEAIVPKYPLNFELNNARNELICCFPNRDTLEFRPYTAQSIRSMMPSFSIVRMRALSIGFQDSLLEFRELVDPPNPELITTQSHIPLYRQKSPLFRR